jgi:hypothetical protein
MAENILESLTKFYSEANIYSCAFDCAKLGCCKQHAKKAIEKEKDEWDRRANALGEARERLREQPRTQRKFKKKREVLLRHGQFTEARSAYVGRHYGDCASDCRLLFLSLDPGSDDIIEETIALPSVSPGLHRGPDTTLRRTPERVQECVAAGLKKDVESHNPQFRTWTHWYGTHRLGAYLLRESAVGDARELCGSVCAKMHDCRATDNSVLRELAETVHYFAHANVVKCSIGMLNNRQAPDGMYRSCKGYLYDELPVMEPDIIVTQGTAAADELQLCVKEMVDASECRGGCEPKCSDRCKGVILHGKKILWIRTYQPAAPPHPGTRGRPFDIEGGACWGCYAGAASSFMDGRRRSRL